ncbi:unnamed protein product [Ambrosiozyma monospora]|uniref:Clathrin light chain n=1 Tax=Ambrosiozyma monospora TaxID=43982 RepID=A0A9W6YVR8_AMBMO|nr:unnamed protein product [Ambrosiozyma monospora]
MSDKFPELEDIADSDLATGGDFLSREKELLGDEFQTEQDTPAQAESSDDEFDAFESQFPEVGNSADAQAEAPVYEPSTEATEAAYGKQTQQDNAIDNEVSDKFGSLNLEESEHIQKWQAERTKEIEQRDSIAIAKKTELQKTAEQNIDDFYENYNVKKDELIKATRDEEEKYVKELNSFLVDSDGGSVWDKAVELLKLSKTSSGLVTVKGTAGSGKEGGYEEIRDKSRFRDLLLSLKGKTNVPGALAV